MGRAGIDQYEALATEEKRHSPVERDVGRHNAGVGVDPWRECKAPLVEPLLGAFAGGLFVLAIFRRPLLRDHDAGAVILERLQAVNVVGVIMADDIVSHRRGSDLFDGFEQIQPRLGVPRASNTTTPSAVTTKPALEVWPWFFCSGMPGLPMV